ncbi:MAG: hypothetical protein PVF45_04555 [Anaerolineae bacterium]|jgi:hypothetical protein
MKGAERPLPAWIALGLLGVLVATNVVFLVLLQTGGPLIGLALYVVLLWRWRQRDYQAAVVGGLVGLAVHVVEILATGWSTYPALMALNLILPTLLAPVAWLANQRA